MSYYKSKFKPKQNIGLRNISELDWPSINLVDQADKDTANERLERFKHPQVIPNLLALLASSQFKLVTVDSIDGISGLGSERKFSFGESLKSWAGHFDSGKTFFFDDGTELTKEDLQGMLSLLRCCPRSVSLPSNATQLSKDWIRYATPVPLYLSAFKQFRNVNYKQWDLTDPKLAICTDKRNLDVIKLLGKEHPWSQGDLVKFRDASRTFKTGAKAGTMRTLNQTYTITATEDPSFNELPENVKLMLCQVWAYQPGCASQYGIYTLDDPDALAQPLVETDIFQESFKDRKANSVASIPSELEW